MALGPALAAQRNAEGSGDASGSPSTATPLSGEGTYFGRLANATDVDWFRESPSSLRPGCLTLRAEATKWAEATLATIGGPAAHRVTTGVPPGSASSPRIGLAFLQPDHARIGLRAIPDPETGAPAEGGPYSFELDIINRSELGPGDAGTGNDAGSTPSSSLAVSGLCTGGDLSAFDPADVYSFEVADAQQIVYSLASNSTATLRVEIFDAAGQPLGPVALNGGIGTVTLPTSGLYFAAVTMSSAPATEYVLALVGPDPPPGNPCRPTCMVS